MQSDTTNALAQAMPGAPRGGVAHLAAAINNTPDAAITDDMRADAARVAAKVDATTEAHAKELTQRWGVWDAHSNDWTTATKLNDGFFVKGAAVSLAAQLNVNGGGYEARPYPTPPPTPPASSGGEWHVRLGKCGGWDVVGPDGPAWMCIDHPKAEKLANRLNAADAMERALKHVDDMLDPHREMRAVEIRDLQQRVQQVLAALRK